MQRLETATMGAITGKETDLYTLAHVDTCGTPPPKQHTHLSSLVSIFPPALHGGPRVALTTRLAPHIPPAWINLFHAVHVAIVVEGDFGDVEGTEDVRPAASLHRCHHAPPPPPRAQFAFAPGRVAADPCEAKVASKGVVNRWVHGPRGGRCAVAEAAVVDGDVAEAALSHGVSSCHVRELADAAGRVPGVLRVAGEDLNPIHALDLNVERCVCERVVRGVLCRGGGGL